MCPINILLRFSQCPWPQSYLNCQKYLLSFSSFSPVISKNLMKGHWLKAEGRQPGVASLLCPGVLNCLFEGEHPSDCLRVGCRQEVIKIALCSMTLTVSVLTFIFLFLYAHLIHARVISESNKFSALDWKWSSKPEVSTRYQKTELKAFPVTLSSGIFPYRS